MKNLVLVFMRALCTMISVGCHCTSNIAFAYGILGLRLDSIPLVAAIIGIYVFIVLKQFGLIVIEPLGARVAFDLVEVVLQILVLVPFFLTQEGELIDLSKTNGLFWENVLSILLGILLLRVFIYVFDHTSFK